MKYYLKDIKWFYVKEGTFAMPYIISKSKTKIKNLKTDEIIDISNGITESVKAHYGITKYGSNTEISSSEDLILEEKSKLRSILPLQYRLKYFTNKKYTRKELFSLIGNIAVGEVRIAMACDDLEYKLFREAKHEARKIASENKRLARQNKKERVARIKTSSESKIRDSYLDF